ncbi:MAG: hypothetical protein ACRD1B_02550 [Thermoanaerobaculia bacterium]
MALRDFGRSDNDLGEWFQFGPTLELRVRRIPYDIANKIRKRYGREDSVVRDGVRYKEFVQDKQEREDMMVDQAAYALTDIRGADSEVIVMDPEAKALWSGYLKKDVELGDTVSMTGALGNDALKKRLLVQIKPYAVIELEDRDPGSGEPTGKPASRVRFDIGSYVLVKAMELNQRAAKEEKAAEGN